VTQIISILTNYHELCLTNFFPEPNAGRVLLFSTSTQSLDLIENFVRTNYSYLRMDGSTPAKKRQALVQQFMNDHTIFLFLLSTKVRRIASKLIFVVRFALITNFFHLSLLLFFLGFELGNGPWFKPDSCRSCYNIRRRMEPFI